MSLLLLGAPVVAAAQAVVTTAAPGAVAVSIYRAPYRGAAQAMDRNFLEGYALVTETRELDLPAGTATVRFEGVAAGMLPESALVTGLPDGVREKNLDADLLSPRSLFARGFGRPVILRRTQPKTGKVTEEPAVIRSGPDGAAIVQTREGFQAVNCSGLKEGLVYQGVPPGLSARPTLSIETQSSAARHVSVRLSYLAWGFDWQANYVATMARDGTHADLTAWVTLASSDSTGFADAETAVVAGKPHRDGNAWDELAGSPAKLKLKCYYRAPPPPPVVAPPPPLESMDIIVTARAVPIAMAVPPPPPPPVMAVREDLGDLKLYRVPVPTTVAANAQKQVALLRKPAVKVQVMAKADLYRWQSYVPVTRVLRTRNRKEDGLGLPLPAGPVLALEEHGGALLPVGEGALPDRAEGEDIDIELGTAPGLTLRNQQQGKSGAQTAFRTTLSNARPMPVRFEGRLVLNQGESVVRSSTPLGRKNGMPLWSVVVPANGTANLSYTVAAAKAKVSDKR
ncbi:DUF4139 domain-containing protein [Novosphingobium sp.]|uniref:DUF4139 domain-containing protein n=1 Tax=Novosphingobium sp. TaxID=1874826 RepID=UPI0038BC6D71